MENKASPQQAGGVFAGIDLRVLHADPQQATDIIGIELDMRALEWSRPLAHVDTVEPNLVSAIRNYVQYAAQGFPREIQ